MRNIIETRELFRYGRVSVVAEMHEDDESPNWPDFDDTESEHDFKTRHQRGDFRYVGMVVNVLADLPAGYHYDKLVLGTDALWGTEHGEVAEGINADAWEIVNPLVSKSVTYMGSSLAEVIAEALRQAVGLFESLSVQVPVDVGAASTWLNSLPTVTIPKENA